MATPSAKDMLMQIQRYADGGTVSDGLTRALDRGLTQDQYYANIRDYATKNTNPLEALNAMTAGGVSMADANAALGAEAVKNYFTVDPNQGARAPSPVAPDTASNLQNTWLASTTHGGQEGLDARIREVAQQNVGNPEALRNMFVSSGANIADLQRAGVDPSVLYGQASQQPAVMPPQSPPQSPQSSRPVTPPTQTQFPQPTPYTAAPVYQPLPEPPPIYGAGKPALDVGFQNSAPRTYDSQYGYQYTPAAKLLSATGSGMSFTPPSVTSRPRELLKVPLATAANPQYSASQQYARDRAAAQLAALPAGGGRFSGAAAPTAQPQVGENAANPANPYALTATDLRFYTPPPIKMAKEGGEIKKSEGTADTSARAMLNNIDSDAPVKRNLPKERQDARRARIGQAPAAQQDYSNRDLTGELLNAASLATAPVPVLGDIAGLAADARMYQMHPEERTMGNYALSALGVLPFVPSAAAIRTAGKGVRTAADKGIGELYQAYTEADRANAGRKAADLIKSQTPVKASEALGQLMERGFKNTTTTQADRTIVGEGNIGGANFSAISEVDPAYSNKVWGVMDDGTASRLINLTTPETAWTTMLGSATQLKTNPIVFDKLKQGFLSSMKQGNLSDELASKINHNLGLTFKGGVDIRDPNIWDQADTFDKRAALADAMMGKGIAPGKGGVALGGEKRGGAIFNATEILMRETERALLHPKHGGDVPTFAAGPRAFSLDKSSVYRQDLHPGFPTLLQGQDLGVNMVPTPTEVYLPDWHRDFKIAKPDRKGPGYYDLALGLKGKGLPSQALNDEYIRHLIREGYAEGGPVVQKYATGNEVSSNTADLLAQMNAIGDMPNTPTPNAPTPNAPTPNAPTPNAPTPAKEQTQSAGMLNNLIGAYEKNISKPMVGSIIDMTLGLGDLGQKGVKYLANRAGIKTDPFVPTAERAHAAAGTTGYDPNTIGGITTNLLPFARGKQLASGAAKTFTSLFPNLGREALIYAGGTGAAAAAKELLPESTSAELLANLAGSVAGGSPAITSMGAKQAVKTAAADLRDLPPLSNSQKTQLGASTVPSYEKAKTLLSSKKILDFGAGRGQGASTIGADTFEPYPREGFVPTYNTVKDIPDGSYDGVTSLNVLNVMPKEVRDDAVKNIGRILMDNGEAVITTRGKDVLTAKGIDGPEGISRITTAGTYQKGFTQPELNEYISNVLGDGFTVSKLPVKIGQAGVLVKKIPQTDSARMLSNLDLAGGKAPPAFELYTPPTNLTDPIAIRFNEEVLKDPAATFKRYADNPETRGGKIIDADIFRELSPDYQANRSLAGAVHPIASALQQGYVQKRLRESLGQRGVWIFPAGGPGSGKTSGMPEYMVDAAHTVVDGTLSDSKRAIKQLYSVLEDPSKGVHIPFVDREPIKALDLAIKRAKKTGRTVPWEVILTKNLEARDAIRKIEKEFAGNPRVQIDVTDNNGLEADAFKSSVDNVKDYDYNKQAEMMKKRLKEAYQSGEIEQNIYAGFDSGSSTNFDPPK